MIVMLGNNHSHNDHPSRSGFTIIELLIVVVIIAILATITVVAYSGMQQRARESGLAADLATADTKMKTYSIEYASLPTTLTQLQDYNFGSVVRDGIICIYGSCDMGSLTVPRGTYLVSVYDDGSSVQINVYYWDYEAGIWRNRWWLQGATSSGELVGPIDEDYGTCTEQDFINCPPNNVVNK